MDWNAMQSIENSNDRFCLHCQKEVKDISELSAAEIQTSLNKSDLCIRATTEQVNIPFAPVKKFGRVGLLIFGLFTAYPSSAQVFSDDSGYSIEQTELKSDTVLLKGIVKGERKLKIRPLRIKQTIGYKKLQNVTISVLSEEGLLIVGAYPDKDGRFEIPVDRRLLGEVFSIVVDDKGDTYYNTIETDNIETKDTNFKFFLREREYIMGRML